MALIVEDGTGLADANAYISVAYADNYFALRGNTVWSALDTAKKEACIIQATDYIDMRWGPFVNSVKTYDIQALVFPRKIWPTTPAQVAKACAEYAVRASVAPLAPDLLQDESGYQITGKKEKVGPLQEDVDYASKGDGSELRHWKSYPGADMLMVPLLGMGGNRVIRNG